MILTKKSINKAIACFFISLLIGNSLQAPSADDFITEFTQASFQTYRRWEVTNPILDLITTCGTLGSIFGGANKLGADTVVTKTFRTQAPHYSLTINFKFVLIDTWESSPPPGVEPDGVRIFLDGNVVHDLIAEEFTSRTSDICGASDADEVKALSYSVDHSSEQFELKFVSHFNEDTGNESWGLRDLIIALKLCDSTCATCSGPLSTDCLSCECPRFLKNGYCKLTCEADDVCTDCHSADFIISEFKASSFAAYDYWSNTDDVTNAFKYCSLPQLSIFGGSGKFGGLTEVTKNYPTTQPHYFAKISFNFMRLDSWESGDGCEFYLMDTLKKDLTISDFTSVSYNFCGTTDYDQEKTFVFELLHNTNSLDVKFVSHFDESNTDESWGIRDLEIALSLCHPSCRSCTGPRYNNCSSCYCPRFLYNGICVESCPQDQSCLSCTQDNDYLIEEFTERGFSRASGWLLLPAVSPPAQTCGTLGSVLGGNTKFGSAVTQVSKVFPTNVNHYSARISFDFLASDSWSSSADSVKVLIEDSQKDLYTLATFTSKTTNYCGSSEADELKSFSYEFAHSRRYLKLFFEPTLTLTGSWAIRNLAINLKTCDSTCQSCTSSGTCCSKCKCPLFYLDGLCLEACPAGETCSECDPGNSYIEEFHESFFNKFDGWSISDSTTSPVTTCGSYSTLFGGVGKFGTNTQTVAKSFPISDAHYELSVSFDFVLIDNWESSDSVQVYGNEVLLQEITSDLFAIRSTNYCGDSSGLDQLINFNFPIPNSNSKRSFNLKFVSQLDEAKTDESWGIKNLVITLKNCNPKCRTCSGPSVNQCLTCSCPSFLFGNSCVETCPEGQSCSECTPEYHYINDFNVTTFTTSPNWVVTSSASSLVSSCGSLGRFFGGVNVFGAQIKVSRNFPTKQPHFKVVITFDFLLIDSWEANDEVTVYVDDTSVQSIQLASFTDRTTNYCGGDGNEEMKSISFETTHSSRSLNLKFVSKFDSDATDESWAFRNLEIILITCHETCKTCSGPSISQCLSCPCPRLLKNGKCVDSCSTEETCSDCTQENYIIEELNDDQTASYSKWYHTNTLDVTTCGNLGKLLGGYSKFGQYNQLSKNYQTTVPHYNAVFSFDFVLIDSWENSDSVMLFMGSNSLSRFENFILSLFSDRNLNYCGGAASEELKSFSYSFSHSSRKQKVLFISNFDSVMTDESWGIKNVILTLLTCHPTCKECSGPASNQCTKCFCPQVLQNSKCVDSCDPGQTCSGCEPNDYYIEEFTDTLFESYSNWMTTNSVVNAVYRCYKEGTYFGGSQFSGDTVVSKIFHIPSPHYYVRITFLLLSMDEWEAGEGVKIFIDDQLIADYVQETFTLKNSNLCGNQFKNDQIKLFTHVGDHSSRSLKLKFVSHFQKDDNFESWGIRDLIMQFSACDPSCKSCDGSAPNKCLSCYCPYFLDKDGYCVSTCVAGQDCGECSPSEYFIEEFNDYPPSVKSPWTITNGLQNAILSCGSYGSFFGGHNYFGENTVVSKTFDTSAPHHRVKIKFTLLSIDTWEAGDGVKLYMDSLSKDFTQSDFINKNSNICGLGGNEEMIAYETVINHISSTLTLKFVSHFDESRENESWGLRELVIELQTCHPSCEVTCSGSSLSSCTGCPDGYFQSISYNDIMGEYQGCFLCNPDCKTCDANGCLSCESDLCISTKNFFYPAAKTCSESCPSGTYQTDCVEPDKICAKCHENCETCDGPGDHNCLTCKLSDLIWYYSETKTCNSACPPGSFIGNSEAKTCSKCHSVCQTCSGSGDHDCLSCDECGVTTSKRLYREIEHTCIEECPPRTFLSNQAECLDCLQNCDQCQDESSCAKCKPNYYIYQRIEGANHYTACLSESDATLNKFIDNKNTDGTGTSKDCSRHCLSCLSSTVCTQCKKRNPFGEWIYRDKK